MKILKEMFSNGIFTLVLPIKFIIGNKLYQKYKDECLAFYVCLMSVVVLATSCSTEKECKTCQAQFINVNTGETINAESDCDRVPPSEGFVFVKCLDNPGY